MFAVVARRIRDRRRRLVCQRSPQMVGNCLVGPTPAAGLHDDAGKLARVGVDDRVEQVHPGRYRLHRALSELVRPAQFLDELSKRAAVRAMRV